MNTVINVTSLQEQTQIGRFFKTLDTLSVFHQRKCEALKEMKKTILSKMFV